MVDFNTISETVSTYAHALIPKNKKELSVLALIGVTTLLSPRMGIAEGLCYIGYKFYTVQHIKVQGINVGDSGQPWTRSFKKEFFAGVGNRINQQQAEFLEKKIDLILEKFQSAEEKHLINYYFENACSELKNQFQTYEVFDFNGKGFFTDAHKHEKYYHLSRLMVLKLLLEFKDCVVEKQNGFWRIHSSMPEDIEEDRILTIDKIITNDDNIDNLTFGLFKECQAV